MKLAGATVEMRKIGHVMGAPFIEELGDAPCPTRGCDGVGTRVRVLDRVLVVSCSECVERAEENIRLEDRQDQVDALLRLAGGTERLERLSFESYPRDRAGLAAIQIVNEWMSRVTASRMDAPNLFLFGAAGTGKTGLMWPVVAELCNRLIPARLVDFPTLLEEMKNSFGKKGSFEDHVRCARVPVLVIDDIGAERPTEWTLGQLHQLVNTRYERCLPTAFVSNYTPGELIEDRFNLGDKMIPTRIVSRMVEGSIQHRIDGKDRRLRPVG